ncbi:phytase [Vibrio sp. B1FLJ16]|uniref:phytase n=1 Tax=Vibrio sp. B1FLJ16 TaxID=2751178 RepID=UPI0015F58680|nr:phytase [Vibrio sp. B1FLJ16]CAD7821285.1 Phytase [Vibrio sp. B1FLJ16]CAE6945823.1 Phytase [Vibrio sp. B1FLJ16]
MRNSLLSSIIMVSLLSGCDSDDTKTVYVEAQNDSGIEAELLTTTAKADTSYDDIGDSAYWMNGDDSDNSLLFVTLEGDGLAVYNPLGKQIEKLNGLVTTGADIRYAISASSGEAVDLLALALPENNSFSFYSIGYDDGVVLEEIGTLPTSYAAEGVCLHKNTTNGELLLTGVTEDGVALQYKLKYESGEIKSVLTDDAGLPIAVRKLEVGGELSACIVDDESATLYIAEQDVGIWAYGADPEDINSRRMVDSIEPLGNLQEVEAIDLLYMSDGNGYLVVGDEGKGMMIYDRDDWQFTANIHLDGVGEVKSLTIADDGIWIANSEADEPVYEKLSYDTLNGASSLSDKAISQVLSPANLSSTGIALVKVIGETDPVDDDGDAADDPAFWLNESSPENSLIIATNKQGGLMAYDLNGAELQYLNEGEPNNVDIIQSVMDTNGDSFSLAAASNREFNTITLYKIQHATESQNPIVEMAAIGENVHEDVAQLKSELNEVYGLCTYQSSDGTPYVFINGKSGDIEQWRLVVQESGIEGSIVRRLKVETQPEGCVVDDTTATLYVGEEDVGVWKFSADESAATDSEMIIAVDGKQLVADAEGITLYNNGTVNYLIVSSQGNHTYAVYNIDESYQYVGSFALVADDENGLDGASETDGIHAVSASVGDIFPNGFFIAQDGFNVDSGYEYQNQNFKMADWNDINSAFAK